MPTVAKKSSEYTSLLTASTFALKSVWKKPRTLKGRFLSKDTHPSCQASSTGGCIQDETSTETGTNVPSIFADTAQKEPSHAFKGDLAERTEAVNPHHYFRRQTMSAEGLALVATTRRFWWSLLSFSNPLTYYSQGVRNG